MTQEEVFRARALVDNLVDAFTNKTASIFKMDLVADVYASAEELKELLSNELNRQE